MCFEIIKKSSYAYDLAFEIEFHSNQRPMERSESLHHRTFMPYKQEGNNKEFIVNQHVKIMEMNEWTTQDQWLIVHLSSF